MSSLPLSVRSKSPLSKQRILRASPSNNPPKTLPRPFPCPTRSTHLVPPLAQSPISTAGNGRTTRDSKASKSVTTECPRPGPLRPRDEVVEVAAATGWVEMVIIHKVASSIHRLGLVDSL